MNKQVLVLVLSAIVTAGVVSVSWSPAVYEAPAVSPVVSELGTDSTCNESSSVTSDNSDPQRVPPGCCTSNCSTNKDCDRICGKGNCICIASNDCCRRCTW